MKKAKSLRADFENADGVYYFLFFFNCSDLHFAISPAHLYIW